MSRASGLFAAVASVAFILPRPATGQSDVEGIVSRIGEYVATYYARAQSIVADEAVRVQPLALDMGPDGFPRRLAYELRVEWNPDAGSDHDAASVTRRLLMVNGRPPAASHEPECLDPHSVSPEPLAFLLPDRHGSYVFTVAGSGRMDDRPAIVVDYRSTSPEDPKVEWKDECASVDLPGRTRGRLWIDPESAEILRLDERIVGPVDIPVPWSQQRRGAPLYMTIDRADSSIRYRRVAFTDPEETLVLPASIETLTIVRNSAVPRVRITQTLGNYRRFVTGSRVVQ